ncbi:MAG: response regulator [Myxococcales bacterium]|nr:response regulator [Myxococcales bacterium]
MKREPWKVLGIDEDKAHQAPVAVAFNQAGAVYRYVTDPKKVSAGIRKLAPDLLLVHGEVRSALVESVLTTLAGEVGLSSVPVALLCKDTSDAHFLTGLRTGVVALLSKPFTPTEHVAQTSRLLEELASRPGSASGQGDSREMARLVEHLRRTLRSGELSVEAAEAAGHKRSGRAIFIKGKLESASYLELKGVEALVTMVSEPRARWRFCEMGGAAGEGAGVVIEVGTEDNGEEEELVAVILDEGDKLGQFELPKEPSPQPAPDRPQEPTSLLLVDDDPALCKLFRNLFEKHGFKVSTAEDGVEGSKAALEGRFDLVIADLNMPRMDGWGMLRVLREDFRTRELPLAFLSCHDDYREALKAEDVGAQAYFSKGTRLDALVGKVRVLLQPRQEVRDRLLARKSQPFNVTQVGPQWLLRELASQGVSARLDAKDGWAEYQLYLSSGKLVHCFAKAGRFNAEGERALNAFLASKACQGAPCYGQFPSPSTLTGTVEELLARASATLNENERRLRDSSLVRASRLEVNHELYELYSQVGPPPWLEVARLICRDRLSPREVIAKVQLSPLDVEEALRDLVRRGVVTVAA